MPRICQAVQCTVCGGVDSINLSTVHHIQPATLRPTSYSTPLAFHLFTPLLPLISPLLRYFLLSFSHDCAIHSTQPNPNPTHHR